MSRAGNLLVAALLVWRGAASPMRNLQEGGARDLQLQTSSNAVPRIGRRADVPSFTSGFLPKSPPNFLKSDFSRLGKRGIPMFAIPMMWKAHTARALQQGGGAASKRAPWTSSWANLVFKPASMRGKASSSSGKRSLMPKRSARPMDSWSSSWADILRSPQGFRLHDGGNDFLSNTVLYKRSEDKHLVSSLNNVPLMGKRSGGEEAKPDGVEMLVRVPREDEGRREKREPELAEHELRLPEPHPNEAVARHRELLLPRPEASLSEPEVRYSSYPIDEEQEHGEDERYGIFGEMPWGNYISQDGGGLMDDVSLDHTDQGSEGQKQLPGWLKTMAPMAHRKFGLPVLPASWQPLGFNVMNSG